MEQGLRLLKIGIFYDGNFFYHVSNYYCYVHSRHARLSIPGLHEFIKQMVSENEHIDERLCQIVDCHYFRGRLPALEAKARRILLNERIFDDILMREGVVTHYLPMPHGTEKGVDVALALETLELSIFKHYNVVVLIASDGDYVPLVRKLNSLGIRVMILAWDFEYMDDNGNLRYTGTSSKLLSESSYPLSMDRIIDGKIKNDRININSLFVPSQNSSAYRNEAEPPARVSGNADGSDDAEMEDMPEDDSGTEYEEGADVPPADGTGAPGRCRGRIIQIKNGYGFIAPDDGSKNLFFFWEDLENEDFNNLRTNDEVSYIPGKNDRGDCAKSIRRI